MRALSRPETLSTAAAAALLGLALLAVPGGSGCAQLQKSRSDNPEDLRRRVSDFHKALRWGEFSEASEVIAPEFRHEFLGRFDEYGDDLEIVGLSIESVDSEGENRRRLEVEQRWYLKPNMSVEDEIFVEIWAKTDDRGWMLEERMKKEEWKSRRTPRDSET